MLRRWRRDSNGGVACIWIAEDVVDRIESEARIHSPLETGGMLVGYAVGRVAVITTTIDGGPNAVRKRGQFVPNGAWQQRQLDQLYEASGRIETFLGDWHSHPRGRAAMSRRDRATALRVARHREARCAHPISIIAASEGDAWEIAAFTLGRGRAVSRVAIHRYAPGTDCGTSASVCSDSQGE